MKFFKELLLGKSEWKNEWKQALARFLEKSQKRLKSPLVVVIARESDLYSELLYLLSILGLGIGLALSYLFRNSFENQVDLLLLPSIGFAFGTTLYHFRRFYLSSLAPKAIQVRVAMRAKSYFFDHWHRIGEAPLMIYFSEIEKEALILSSPKLIALLPQKEIQSALSRLMLQYSQKNPLHTLEPCLEEIASLLRLSVGEDLEEDKIVDEGSLQFIASDSRENSFNIPVLKGSKDIN